MNNDTKTGEISSAEAPAPATTAQLDERDRLYIVKPGFEDPAFPGQIFYCWHCALMEGLLASFPDLNEKLDIRRISWPSPRNELIGLLGLDNQSVPVLVLAEKNQADLKTRHHNGRRFIDDKDTILNALHLLYGIPVPHP